MWERFNKTLMLGILSYRQKSDRRANIPTLAHAYNAVIRASIRYALFCHIFVHHPRHSVDAFLGLWVDQTGNDTSSFIYELKVDFGG